MCADFRFVPFDFEEVKQVAPPPEELEVNPHAEDGSFAHDLAEVQLQHVNALVTLCQVFMCHNLCSQSALYPTATSYALSVSA